MECRNIEPLDADRLEEVLARIRGARVVVLGDYCLDIYWFIDRARSEESLETGLMTSPVRHERHALGGAGNVLHNMAAMGCSDLCAIGLVGDDPWGREMGRLLADLGVDTSGLLVQDEQWATLAYAKPYAGQEEGSRFDFGNFNRVSEASVTALLSRLEQRIGEVDVVVVNQQVREGIHSEGLRKGLVALMREMPDKVVVADSRHYTEFYEGAWLKINAHEACRLCGIDRRVDELVLRDEVLSAASRLFDRFRRPIIVTRGSRGLVVRDDAGLHEVPGIRVPRPVDTVGAGDSVLAGLGLGLAAGYDPVTATQFGNVVAAVTIQKLNETGTASPEELLAVGTRCDTLHHPELAEDPGKASRRS